MCLLCSLKVKQVIYAALHQMEFEIILSEHNKIGSTKGVSLERDKVSLSKQKVVGECLQL